MSEQIEQQDGLETIQEVEVVVEVETEPEQEKESEDKDFMEPERAPTPVVVVEDETASQPTTFAAWDAESEAAEKASDMQFLTHQFQVLVGNVMQSPDVEDKGAAVEVLSRELSQRLNMVKERKSKWQPLTDKAVNFINGLRKKPPEYSDKDFGGGCSFCGFGDSELIKDLTECQFCHNTI